MTPKEIQFSISSNDARTLLDQVVDGFREAIASGNYKPGDKIPSSRALCPVLGVSRAVRQVGKTP